MSPAPSESSQVVTLMRVPRGVGAEEGAGLEAASARGRGGGGARLGHPDCDLGLKDFRNGLGAEKAGGRHGIFPDTGDPATPGIPRAWSPGKGERAHVRLSSSTS